MSVQPLLPFNYINEKKGHLKLQLMFFVFFSSFITGVEKQYFLVDVVFMDRCNYSTVSQAILASLHSNALDLNDAWAVVTDNAAYCLKAYREVLKGVMPNSVHVTCLCHIINLVGETWQHFTCHMDEICVLQKACQKAKMGFLPHQQGGCAGQGSS